MTSFLTYRSPSPDDERMSTSSHSHSHSSGDMSMTSSEWEYDSDVERAPSVYSYSESRDQLMLRECWGRSVNAQNELYALPADAEESTRITTQHALLRLLLSSSLYLPRDLVKHALSPLPHRPRAILDLGTGPGFWAEDMAREWPDAEVVGVDLAPQFRRAASPPPNCRFELDDVTLGLSHYRHTFDLVHSRSIANGIRDFPAYILDALSTLRPGGVLLLAEGDLQLVSFPLSPSSSSGPTAPDPHRVGADESPLQRLLFHAYSTLKSHGSSVDAGSLFPSLLSSLSSPPMPKISNAGYTRVYAPIGAWVQGSGAAEQRMREVGEMMRWDAGGFCRALRPLLLSEGYEPDVVDSWIGECEAELAGDGGEKRLCTVWHYAWCEKVRD